LSCLAVEEARRQRYIHATSDVPDRRGADPLLRSPSMTSVARHDDLTLRRRRLKFRAWHRGMQEVDILLGRFADAHLDGLDEAGLAGFEALLQVPDQDILAWISHQAEPSAEDDSPLLRRIIAFHHGTSP
jgi:antitoxin CptB